MAASFRACTPTNACSITNVSSLGDIPPECGFTTAEVSSSGNVEQLKDRYPILNNMLIVRDSDAHYLQNMKDKENFFELSTLTIDAVLEKLKND